MGTRADFYVGKGRDAEWIGSIAYDGYRTGIDEAVLKATTENEFRSAVARFFESRDDATTPDQGWPWPWETSEITDCSYWFFDCQVWEEDSAHYRSMTGMIGDRIEFPDMSEKKNITLGPRSGLLIIGLKV